MYRVFVVFFFVKSLSKLLDFTSTELLRAHWKTFDVFSSLMVVI